MIYYKIRNKADPELFISGTPIYHRFDKYGRVFQKLGMLRAFLTRSIPRVDISNWEVVEIEQVIKEVKSVNDVIDPKHLVKLLAR